MNYLNITNWKDLDWKGIRERILKRQVEIYRAVEYRNINRMIEIQNSLLNNHENKLLATRRVTQDNRGKRTPGIDKIAGIKESDRIDFALSLEINGSCSPIRRIYIPKPNGELRPLGIPTIKDRAKQALIKSVLEPEWEAKFEPGSFGFRPGRSAQNANHAIFNSLFQKEKYVLDADIRKCFDQINHEALLNKLENSQNILIQIKSWLKAGIFDNINNINTDVNELGTPQGGIISPLLCNIALNGIRQAGYEEVVKVKGTKAYHSGQIRSAYSLIRYADDFVAFHPRLDILLSIKEGISKFLKPLNLELHPDKTRIVHTSLKHDGHEPGFSFLSTKFYHMKTRKHGQNSTYKDKKGKIVKYPFILKSHPDTKSINKHLDELRTIIRKNLGTHQLDLIKILSPKIRGWSNYFSTTPHDQTFGYCDHKLFWYLYNWSLRRHPSKGKIWVAKKYFHTDMKINNGKVSYKKWVFATKYMGYLKYKLSYHSDVKYKKCLNMANNYSPYNPTYYDKLITNYQSEFKNKLYKRQNGICRECGGPLLPDDIMEVHHLIPKGIPERKKLNLTWLIHGHCHDNIHKRRGHFAVVEEEPYEG